MNYAVYSKTDGAILMHGFCVALDQVEGHAGPGIGVVEVDSDVSAETHIILDGLAVLKGT
jgi:hypothetical protein